MEIYSNVSNGRQSSAGKVSPSDAFGYRPAATVAEIMQAIQPAMIAFPSMQAGFWEMLANKIALKGWCKERVAYMVERVTEDYEAANSYRFNRLTTADFLNQPTVELRTYTPAEAATLQNIVEAQVAGKTLLISRQQAEFAIYPYAPYVAIQKENTGGVDSLGAVTFNTYAMPVYTELRLNPIAADYAASLFLLDYEPRIRAALKRNNATEARRIADEWRTLVREDVARNTASRFEDWRAEVEGNVRSGKYNESYWLPIAAYQRQKGFKP